MYTTTKTIDFSGEVLYNIAIRNRKNKFIYEEREGNNYADDIEMVRIQI